LTATLLYPFPAASAIAPGTAGIDKPVAGARHNNPLEAKEK
jgi:hypothetical protein